MLFFQIHLNILVIHTFTLAINYLLIKIADEISYEILYRSHMSDIRITILYENYMRTHMRSLLVSITISYEISYNIFTQDRTTLFDTTCGKLDFQHTLFAKLVENRTSRTECRNNIIYSKTEGNFRSLI